MPENLSRIILAVGAKVNYENAWYVSEVDVINDIGAKGIPKLVIFPIEGGLFVPVSVDTDWSSYTFTFKGTYRSEEAARRNFSGMMKAQTFQRTCRWVLGVASLGAFEVVRNVLPLFEVDRGGYVLDSFAYHSLH